MHAFTAIAASLIGIAAVLRALAYLWKSWLKPASRAVKLAQQRIAFIHEQFFPNSGGSLRDQLDQNTAETRACRADVNKLRGEFLEAQEKIDKRLSAQEMAIKAQPAAEENP